jgi:hypothetical protein
MNWNLLWLFVGLNVVNVIIQTVKSIATVKCGKTVAALVNALAYGLYTFVVIYMTIDGLNIWVKAGIIALCNLVGVWVVKFIEEKSRKDKLWKVEATVLRGYTQELHQCLTEYDIPHNYLENVGPYTLFNVYCATQEQSRLAKMALDGHFAKYFVSESKSL